MKKTAALAVAGYLIAGWIINAREDIRRSRRGEGEPERAGEGGVGAGGSGGGGGGGGRGERGASEGRKASCDPLSLHHVHTHN